MPQPPAYTRTADFSADEAANVGGRSTVRTAALDAELDAAAATLAQVLANLALNQRDDGEIRDRRVKLHTLAPEVLALMAARGTPRGAWTTGTAYALFDLVNQDQSTYAAVTAHTAGTFSTDLAAGRWLMLANGTPQIASGVPFTPAGAIAATNVQAAIEETNTEIRALVLGIAGEAGALEADLAASGGAAMIGHGTGTVADALRVRRSLLEWMQPALKALVTARGTYTASDRLAVYVALSSAWSDAVAGGFDLYAPAGLYDTGENSLPFGRVDGSPPVALLDCKNVTIYGDGPLTTFKTTSVGGADVLQINGAKNFHGRNFSISADLTGFAGSGSNGISITGGFDNITLLDVWVENCRSLDKTTYVDGGKALTVQCDAATLEVGSLKARVFAKGCAQGFGFEAGLFNFLGKKVAVDVDVVADGCFQGVTINAPEAVGALPDGTHIGVRVKAQLINCQKSVELSRAHGVQVDAQVITTSTEAARRLSPYGAGWFAADTVVEGLGCAYAKNSQIRVTGNVGACAYKARIGGIGAGGSGLNGSTQHCDIFIDLGGTASVAAVAAVDSGGNTMSSCRLAITSNTSATLPAEFYAVSANNVLTIGPVDRLVNPQVSGALILNQNSAGNVETGRLALNGVVTGLQGKGTSSTNAVIAGLYDQGGTFRFGIVNGSGLAVDALGSGSAIGSYIGKHPLYNSSGTLIGWIPVYG